MASARLPMRPENWSEKVAAVLLQGIIYSMRDAIHRMRRLRASVFLLVTAGLTLAGHAQGAPLRQDAPSPVHWRTTCIECPLDVFQLGEHALRLDSRGRPHVVYASDQLYYAVWDGAAWQVEVIDATPGADDRTYQSGAALVLDKEQTPRLAYFSRDNRALKYAVRTPQGWRSEEIERTPPHRWMSRGVSLVTSTDDTGTTRVWIAYTNYGVLRLAAQTASGWELTTIDNSGWSEENVALALGSDGRPHISYFYYTGAGGPDLRYARWDGSQWRIEAVDIPGRVGYGNTMALDADGHAHIAYMVPSWQMRKDRNRSVEVNEAWTSNIQSRSSARGSSSSPMRCRSM